MTIDRIRKLLGEIYGGERANELADRLADRCTRAGKTPPARQYQIESSSFDETSAVLITYADILAPADAREAPGDKHPDTPADTPLDVLASFLRERVAGLFSHLHILPFFPWTSDDGFSVADYSKPDPRYGTWADIEALGADFSLAFDLVLNHGSAQSQWFRDFLAGDPRRKNWYLTRPEGWKGPQVVRPRTSPLLTEFSLGAGRAVHVWTTFSDDQVDFDWSNPDVLLAFVDILLMYMVHGCELLRLDAIAYLWKEDGTPCIHHPKTHAMVKLFRALIDAFHLPITLLTETNVPHEENVSYFGAGDEAHMVYNFPLPPLTLHAAVSGDAGPLRDWARTLEYPEHGIFLNFLASHDGIGLTPAKGLVDEAAFAATLERCVERGALISTKATPQGPIPYELNSAWLSAVAPPGLGLAHHRARAFLATHAVLLALRGVPAIWFHSLFGGENWVEGPEVRGYKRAINREKPGRVELEARLADPAGLPALVFAGLEKLLTFRAAHPAFAPASPQRVIESAGAVFALVRGPDAEGEYVLCAMNLGPWPAAVEYVDETISMIHLSLEPWQTRWVPFTADGLLREDELCT